MPDTAPRTCAIPVYTADRGTLIRTGTCPQPATHTFTTGTHTYSTSCARHTTLIDGFYPTQPIGTPQ